MKTRIITGVAMFLAILVIFLINSYVLNFFILGVVLFLAFNEAAALYGLENRKNLAFIALAFYSLAFFTNPVYIAILAILIIASFLAHVKAENLNIILPFIYPAVPVFMIWAVYSEYGLAYLVWLVLAVVASDSGAYFVGKKYGKTPFSQSSPNKTREGVLGGLFLGTIIGSMCGYYIIDGIFHVVITSFLICAFGVWGDLFESYLKRKADVKDSGNLLPGHGGMLDRIDGYLFGAPALLWAMSW